MGVYASASNYRGNTPPGLRVEHESQQLQENKPVFAQLRYTQLHQESSVVVDVSLPEISDTSSTEQPVASHHCIYIHVYTDIRGMCLYTCTHVYVHVLVCECIHTSYGAYMYTYMYTLLFTCTCTFKQEAWKDKKKHSISQPQSGLKPPTSSLHGWCSTILYKYI